MLFVTRRTEGRVYRLAGSAMEAAFAIFWGAAAQRTGVKPACWAVLSDHYHAVVCDPDGKLADFLRDVHSGVARFGNALDEVDQHFWDGQQTFVEELFDADAVIAKMAYVIANPVLHRLVESPAAWRGLLTSIDDIGRERGPRYERPAAFFADDGPMSESVELLSFVPPMCEAAYGVEGFRERLRSAVARLVAEARTAARADGRGFVGMKAVRARRRDEAPTTPSGRSAGRHATAGKRIASSEREALRALLERLRHFRELHRAAWEAFMAGVRDVVFPAGTWFAWRFYGAMRDGTDRYERPPE